MDLVILPISVFIPVATAIPLPLPLVKVVLEYTMFSLSPTVAFSPLMASTVLATGSDSPVSMASSTSKLSTSMSLQSAGTTSPTSKTMMSPGTTPRLGILSRPPSRMTLAVGEAILLRASIVFSARYSWTKPTEALKMMTKASTPPSAWSCTAKDTTAATSKMTVRPLVSWPSITFHGFTPLWPLSSLGPNCFCNWSTTPSFSPLSTSVSSS
ncbi:hypothetical protein Mapa_004973 [Marchantia paleacea]|nr:hypothetical protein Mapa_004973 [Marchantia paleacea]